MAIVLDDHARSVIARRQARGKDATVFLHLKRSTMRTGMPWTVVVDWAPPRRGGGPLIEEATGGAGMLVDARVARYAHNHDLTVSAASLGPWEWLVVTDPFAYEHMQEWETNRPSMEPATSTTVVLETTSR